MVAASEQASEKPVYKNRISVGTAPERTFAKERFTFKNRLTTEKSRWKVARPVLIVTGSFIAAGLVLGFISSFLGFNEILQNIVSGAASILAIVGGMNIVRGLDDVFRENREKEYSERTQTLHKELFEYFNPIIAKQDIRGYNGEIFDDYMHAGWNSIFERAYYDYKRSMKTANRKNPSKNEGSAYTSRIYLPDGDGGWQRSKSSVVRNFKFTSPVTMEMTTRIHNYPEDQ